MQRLVAADLESPVRIGRRREDGVLVAVAAREIDVGGGGATWVEQLAAQREERLPGEDHAQWRAGIRGHGHLEEHGIVLHENLGDREVELAVERAVGRRQQFPRVVAVRIERDHDRAGRRPVVEPEHDAGDALARQRRGESEQQTEDRRMQPRHGAHCAAPVPPCDRPVASSGRLSPSERASIVAACCVVVACGCPRQSPACW